MGHIGNKLLTGLVHSLQFAKGLLHSMGHLSCFAVSIFPDICIQIPLCHPVKGTQKPLKGLYQEVS